MRSWLRPWVSELSARRRGAPTAVLIIGASTVVTTAMWLLAKEVFLGLVSENALHALLNGPAWLQLLVGGMMLSGVAAAAASFIRHRHRPQPDGSLGAGRRSAGATPGAPDIHRSRTGP